jgi:hypothetical protein
MQTPLMYGATSPFLSRLFFEPLGGRLSKRKTEHAFSIFPSPASCQADKLKGKYYAFIIEWAFFPAFSVIP